MSFQSLGSPEDAAEASASPAVAGHDIELPEGFGELEKYPEMVEALLSGLEKIEDELISALATADELAEAITRHLLDAGGKRVRPILTVLAGMLGDPDVTSGKVAEPNESVRKVAVSLELTHLATLYHDDVMDEADQRRGAPAAHIQWSNSIAILAGDLIFARASNKMSDLGTYAGKVHTQTFEELVMGQLKETVGPEDGEDPIQHYLDVLHGKTASLIATAAHLGAKMGGVEDDVIAMMKSYGEYVGMAFQLADDIIDVSSTSEESGKVRGTDLKERVPTLPILLLRQDAAAGDEQAQKVLELIDGPLDTDEQLHAAVDALSTHPVIERAWKMTYEWSDKAINAIGDLPESPVKLALVGFAEYVVDRTS